LNKALNVRYWLRQFASDNEYGDWVKRSIPEKLNTAKKRTTLFYYRQLAEFGKWCGTLSENSPHRADRKSLFNYRQLAEFSNS
tara:strand:+ start:184 stop:432 length:249 start_codon:yes stop_codon:yes gene_type:complete